MKITGRGPPVEQLPEMCIGVEPSEKSRDWRDFETLGGSCC